MSCVSTVLRLNSVLISCCYEHVIKHKHILTVTVNIRTVRGSEKRKKNKHFLVAARDGWIVSRTNKCPRSTRHDNIWSSHILSALT